MRNGDPAPAAEVSFVRESRWRCRSATASNVRPRAYAQRPRRRSLGAPLRRQNVSVTLRSRARSSLWTRYLWLSLTTSQRSTQSWGRGKGEQLSARYALVLAGVAAAASFGIPQRVAPPCKSQGAELL
jgi:hypothetical protein